MGNRIAVVGSANVDLVAVTRRAPGRGETVTGERFFTATGGKGANQAIAAAKAGGDVAFVGAVGSDAFAAEVMAAFTSAGVKTRLVRTVDGPTGTAHVVVDGDGANSIVVVPGANASVTGLSAADRAAVRDAAVVLLQLEIPLDGVRAAIGCATGQVLLDPAPACELPPDLLAGVGLLLPNAHEAALMTGADDADRALATLLDRVPAVAVTLGADGLLYGERGAEPVRIAAPIVDVLDSTAAGDALAGALAVGLVDGLSPVAALHRAVAAASLSVQREGASPSMPTRAEIDAAEGALATR